MRSGARRLLGSVAVGGAVLLTAWALKASKGTVSPALASAPVTDQPETTNADPPAPAPVHRFDRGFWLGWFLPLMAIAVLSMGSSVPLFFGAFPGTAGASVAEPGGGILMLIDAKAPGMDGGAQETPRTAVTAETWTTGFEGANELSLKLEFPPALAGSRWYVVASGQYFPDRRLDTSLFCDIGHRVVREADRTRCLDTEFNGSTGIEYRYDDQIGSAGGSSGDILTPIDSLMGFDADSAAIITGTVANRTDTPTRISIPYFSPEVGHPGGDDLVRLAPIGVTDQEWGGLRPVRGIAAGYTDVFSQFADVQSGQGLVYMPLLTLRFDVRGDALGGLQITTAMPPTIQPDRLAWEQKGGGIGPFLYRLHDPTSETDTAVSAFLAGLIASTGAAALLLLVEQVLVRRQKQPARA